MRGSSQSREVLTMDQGEVSPLTFTKKRGCFLSQGASLCIVVLFISCAIVTGLLVYYLAPSNTTGTPCETYTTLEAKEHQQHLSKQHETVQKAGPGSPFTIAKDTSSPGTMSSKPTKDSNTMDQTTTATKKKNKNNINVRLPLTLRPIHYIVHLQPFINGNFSIHGSVKIHIEVIDTTKTIYIHMADIITKNDTIKVVPSDSPDSVGVSIMKSMYDNERQFYVAHLGQPLIAGKTYIVSMDFVGLLNDQLEGFYRSVYKDTDGNEKWLATTQFQATDARRAFPCFDEPGLKATFSIFIARQTNMTAISNMPRINTVPIVDQIGWVWDQFNTTVPMSTYLVAFVVSDFTHLNSTGSADPLFRVWARRSAIDQAEYARKIGPQILRFFEDYFNIPFPLPKSDMIAIPDFSAGAMENWGLITYRETAMLYDPAVSASYNKQRVGVVIAHELAHQWFGNLVTPVWWTDLWLNEGFATFLEYLGANAAEPTWKMLEQFVIKDLQDVFAIDCLESSHPISIPVHHPSDINEIFDRISYGKGASIIRMMNHFMTENTFRTALTNFLNELKYANAEQDDLWRYLTTQGHTDGTLNPSVTIKMIMDTWTLQMGYPVLTVNRDHNGMANVTQERFLMVRNPQSTDTHKYMWWIPISYTTEDQPNFKDTRASEWLSDVESNKMLSNMPKKNKWVLFNIQQTGYYRVNYDQENWEALIRQLKEQHTVIHVNNRAQIIDDALNLARAGLVSYNIVMGVNSYLEKETEYVPWKAAINNLGYINTMFKKTAGYGALKKYLMSLLQPLYQAVGFKDMPSDPQLDKYKRISVVKWTCSLGYKTCIDNCVSLYQQWMEQPSNNSIISPDLKSTVYCTAIKHGGEKEWDFAWQRYLASNVATEKAKLLSALGCTREIWLLTKYMDMGFMDGSGVRKQDATRVFGSIAANDVGTDLAWDYLRLNWDKIVNYFGEGMLGSRSRLLKSATYRLNTELQLEELEKFNSINSESLGSAKRAVKQSTEKTNNNIEWMTNNYNVIHMWLKDNKFA